MQEACRTLTINIIDFILSDIEKLYQLAKGAILVNAANEDFVQQTVGGRWVPRMCVPVTGRKYIISSLTNELHYW